MMYDTERKEWAQSKTYKQWNEHSQPAAEDKAWIEAKNLKFQEMGVTLSDQRWKDAEAAKKRGKGGKRGKATVIQEGEDEEVAMSSVDDVVYDLTRTPQKEAHLNKGEQPYTFDRDGLFGMRTRTCQMTRSGNFFRREITRARKAVSFNLCLRPLPEK